jgi:hypothetical protein
MALSTTLIVKVVADTTQAAAKLQSAGKTTSKWASGIQKAALPAIAIGTAALAGADMVIDAAKKQQQAMAAVDTVFGKSADTVKAWAATAADSVGLAAADYARTAALIGSQLGNLGIPQDQVIGKTKDLIKMGADLAATYGGTTVEAVQALSATLRGEYDPIERYGINVKQADVNARLLAKGQNKLTGQQAKAARAAAVLALMQQAGATTADQFARNSNTLAVAQQKAAAKFENAKAAIGQALLPAMTALTTVLAGVAQWAGKHPKLFTAIIVAVLALAAAVIILNVALAITNALAAPLVVPILAIVAAIALFVAAVVLAWKNSEAFRTAVLKAWAEIKSAAGSVAAAAVDAWRQLQPTFQEVAATVRTAVPAMIAAWKILTPSIGTTVTVIKALIRAIVFAIQVLWSSTKIVIAGVVAQWRMLRSAVAIIATAIAVTFRAVATAARTLWSAVVNAANGIRSAWQSVRNSVAVDWLVNAFRTAKDTIIGIFDGIANGIAGAIDRVKSMIQSLIDKIKSIPGIPSALKPFLGVAGLAAPAPVAPAPMPATAATTHTRSTSTDPRSPANPLAGATFQLVLDGQVVEKAVTKVTVAQNRILARRILNGRPAQ